MRQGGLWYAKRERIKPIKEHRNSVDLEAVGIECPRLRPRPHRNAACIMSTAEATEETVL